MLGNRMIPDAESDDNGNFSIGPFPSGNYIVLADVEPPQEYVSMYYDGAFYSENASPVAVVKHAIALNNNRSALRTTSGSRCVFTSVAP